MPQQADFTRLDPKHPLYRNPCIDGTHISRDPHLQLGCSVVLQAMRDLKDAHIIDALDALCWWLDDGALWLGCLELDCAGDETDIFINAVKGASYERLYFGRAITR